MAGAGPGAGGGDRGPGRHRTSIVAPDGAVTRMASPCPTSSATRCPQHVRQGPQCQRAKEHASHNGQGHRTTDTVGRCADEARCLGPPSPVARASAAAAAASASLRGSVVAGLAKRPQTIARAGYQPSAGQPAGCLHRDGGERDGGGRLPDHDHGAQQEAGAPSERPAQHLGEQGRSAGRRRSPPAARRSRTAA